MSASDLGGYAGGELRRVTCATETSDTAPDDVLPWTVPRNSVAGQVYSAAAFGKGMARAEPRTSLRRLMLRSKAHAVLLVHRPQPCTVLVAGTAAGPLVQHCAPVRAQLVRKEGRDVSS